MKYRNLLALVALIFLVIVAISFIGCKGKGSPTSADNDGYGISPSLIPAQTTTESTGGSTAPAAPEGPPTDRITFDRTREGDSVTVRFCNSTGWADWFGLGFYRDGPLKTQELVGTPVFKYIGNGECGRLTAEMPCGEVMQEDGTFGLKEWPKKNPDFGGHSIYARHVESSECLVPPPPPGCVITPCDEGFEFDREACECVPLTCEPTTEPECIEQKWSGYPACQWVGECVCEPEGEPECEEQKWDTESCSWVGNCCEPCDDVAVEYSVEGNVLYIASSHPFRFDGSSYGPGEYQIAVEVECETEVERTLKILGLECPHEGPDGVACVPEESCREYTIHLSGGDCPCTTSYWKMNQGNDNARKNKCENTYGGEWLNDYNIPGDDNDCYAGGQHHYSYGGFGYPKCENVCRFSPDPPGNPGNDMTLYNPPGLTECER